MTELSLYKFVKENELEYHALNDDTILFIENRNIEEWNKLLGNSILDESGLDCTMKIGYFCFMVNSVCDYFGINPSNIFK